MRWKWTAWATFGSLDKSLSMCSIFRSKGSFLILQTYFSKNVKVHGPSHAFFASKMISNNLNRSSRD